MALSAEKSRSAMIADHIRQAIQNGTWPIESKLPSTRQLALDHHASLSTVHSALRELEMLGLIERRARSGIRVVRRHPVYPGRQTGSGADPGQVAIVLVRWRENISDSASHAAMIELQQAVAQSGYNAWPVFVDPHADHYVKKLQQQLQQAADRLIGVILINSRLLKAMPRWLDQHNLPWVWVNQPDRLAMENFVGVDYLASFALGQCLAYMGLDDVLTTLMSPVSTPTTVTKFTEFVRGYTAAAGRTPKLRSWFHNDDFQQTKGEFEFLCSTLAQPDRPRVVFAGWDASAMQVLRACRQVGLSVPGDLLLIGGTGIVFSAYTDPPLTVLGGSAPQAARAAVKMLERMIDTGIRRLPGCFVPARVTIRQSLPIPDNVVARLSASLRPLVQSDTDTTGEPDFIGAIPCLNEPALALR